MKEMRRILALVMCVVMLVGYMPVSAHATEDTGVAAETPVVASDVPSEEPSSEASGETTEPETVAVTGITLNPTELVVPVDEPNMALTVTVLPENATDKTVTWSSSNPEVVAVDEYGTMSFHKVGEAVITAAIGDFSATCNVTVGEAEPVAYVQSRASSTMLTAAIFFSDVHEDSTGTSGSGTSAMKSVLSKIGGNGVSYETIGLVGDTYSDKAGTMANMTSAAQGALGQTIPCYYAYGDHDEESDISPDSGLMYTGDYYYIYHISDANMRSQVASQSDIGYETAISNFKTAAASMDKSKVLFIMSHVPLHDRRDDNTYANSWYTAIKEVADTMEVVFFWAHNHTSESDVDRAAYYVARDGSETITIYNGDTVTPNFTYMNAGYIYAAGQNPSRKGVATTVEIYADSLIFQDYNSSGTYTDSSYSHNVTVTREFTATSAATLESITVSGDTDYFVGDELNLTVTATYSDDSTADVTADAALSGYDMSTAGTYTVTATYGELTAEYAITVSAPAMTKIEITTLPTTVIYDKGDELSTEGMVVTATYDNGTTADVTEKAYVFGTVDMTTAGEKTVTIACSDNGTIFKATYTITVNDTLADGMVLTALEITSAPARTEYLLNDALDITGMVVKATFSDGTNTEQKELTYAGFINSEVEAAAADTYAYYIDGFNMHVEKQQAVTVSYTYGEVTKTATFTINVWNEDFADETTGVKVSVAEGDYGVTAVNVVESTNENVSAAIAEVISGTNYKAWDITLTLDADVDENGEAVYGLTNSVKTVTLPIPSGVNNPVVYYVSDEGEVEPKNVTAFTETTVTFETTHFSTYVIGESAEIEVPENLTQTDSKTNGDKKTVYVLTSSISSGNQYLIVNGNAAGSYYALKNNGGSVDATGVTIKTDDTIGTYIELDDATNELWTVGSGYTFKNGSDYLGYTSSGSWYNPTYTFGLSETACTWSYSTSNHRLSTSVGDWNSTTYYLRYNSGWTWTSSNSASGRSVYFYVPTNIDTSSTKSGTYTIEGKDITVAVSEGSQANLTSTLTFTPAADNTATVESPVDVSTTAAYEIVTVDANGNTVDGDPNDIISKIENGVVTFTGNYGTALVKVSYTTDFGPVTDYITIEATAPYYSIDLCKPVTDADGNTTYESITAPIALKNIKTGDTYSVWAVIKEHNSEYPEGEDLGDVEDDRIYWSVSDQAIATIDSATGEISFTGIYYGTITVTAHYLDENGEILCSDSITISVSATSATVPGDGTDDFPEYPNEGAVRHDKTATAVGNFSETGVAKVELSMTGVPFTTGSEIDVVMMLDMTGSMSDDGMAAAVAAAKAFVQKIVKNTDGTYNKNRVAVYQFNSSGIGTYFDLQMISSDAELETALGKIVASQSSGGTPFDEAAQKCYNVLQAAKTDGTGNDRQQFCVFMSDGGPTSYEGSDGYTYYAGNNTSGDRALTSYIGGYTSSTASDWTYNLPTEYYTDAMKADGVTVYTVGLLLQNVPSNPSPYSNMTDSDYDSTTDSLTTIGSHYYFTSTILKNMATDSSKYIDIFDVDNADKATAAFESIAKDILAAATDVTVADKIGTNYTMVFDAPNSIVDEADGGQEYYIEVTDYPLNPVYADENDENSAIVDYTRGTGTSLLKLYFGYNATTGYYAATDANGTKAETPTFDTVTLGDKGTKHYWTTVAADGDSDVSVVGADGTTYYFVSTGDGTHNMTAGAYASGTNTTVTLTHEDGTTSTSSTCQNMIIATPYFVYNAATKMLIWTLEEISDNEVTLTYFLYLNNSGGFSGTEQEIDPETYTTNQFAYVDYTNFQNTECRLEFPVPQMTWNGAQVSYVFYLVNEAGQPVNRAGRVVPFSEAVYVTKVYTHAIVWNDLEQSAGLEAQRLAYDLVPEVYALYDQGAEYNIHVYEDEGEVNLNNHFIITSSVDSDDSTTNNGVYTTYVFNTKADAHKYNVPGTYVVDNNNNTAYESGQTYWCKSYDVTGTFEKKEEYDELYGTYYTYTVTSATYSGSETQVPESDMESTTGGTVIGGYVYYVDENEEIYTIVLKNDGNEVQAGFDFSNTTVAFAVLWKPELVEDVVVVDYGLDVVIDVATNDALASGVVGVRDAAPSNVTINSGTYDSAEAKSVELYINADHDEKGLKELKIGTASVESLTSVRFSLDKTNGMQFSDPAIFYYESDVNYYNEDNNLVKTSMYSKVTVIPATTVYYEDSYVDLKVYTDADDELHDGTERVWVTEGTAMNAVQATDRPGVSKISEAYDADNNYGYDGAYTNMSVHSMGSARMLTVDSTYYGTAEFTFYGTGFDVISTTSNLTGTIVVQVADADGNIVRNKIVDTYYGYKLTDGEWEVTTNDPNALYQVPVITVEDLDYGKYTVTITAAYNKFFAHNGATSYDIYLDAIRIYDPTGNEDETANEAYAKDGEGWPSYFEVRNEVIDAATFNSLTADATISGMVFIDGGKAGADTTVNVGDYTSYGPNNELYLAASDAVTFDLNATAKAGAVAKVQLAVKTVGGTGTVEVYSVTNDTKTTCLNEEITTATDLYYDITALNEKTVVIKNAGTDGIISITNVKVTYTEAQPEAAAEPAVAMFSVRRASVDAALMTMSVEDTEVEETVPETTVPEETEPETTVPETTVPEETEPEETVPETTVPEETEPEDPAEQIKEIVQNVVNQIVNALSNLFSKWFR